MARTTYVRITKTPQCRHRDRFATYTSQTIGGITGWKAACSNCSSVTDYYTQPGADPHPAIRAQEAARDALMAIEAPPVVEP